jgi:hypothetical protein
MRLLELQCPSIRKPANFSSGLANSVNGGKARRLRKIILSLYGENDNAGTGGASTMSLISGGGTRYPTPNAKSSNINHLKQMSAITKTAI